MIKSKTGRKKRRTKRRPNLSFNVIQKLSEAEAYETLKLIRFAETGGRPACPFCGCERISEITTRRRFKCRECKRQFSVTSGTVWSRSKMPYQKLLLMAAHFAVPATPTATTTFSRLIEFSEMSTHFALHKIREAIGGSLKNLVLGGTCEVDGAQFGGYTPELNDRTKKRYPRNTDKIQVLGVAIERRGNAITAVVDSEKDLVPFVRTRVANCKTLHTDEASHWVPLGESFIVKTIAHKYNFSTQWLKDEAGKWVKQEDGACTNQAESFFARERRSEDVHVHISGKYLDLYGHDDAWRHNSRFLSDAERYLSIIKICLSQPVSRRFKGHRQTRFTDGKERGSPRTSAQTRRGRAKPRVVPKKT